ncbi:RagB/SusD family nutrient uptake outer membrane protein [Flavobacterium sp. NG2]|uniref:RagB/SusD family nutrient uptake outer membrane protein n=1 Tax=Flavobacterium sp. NG2 TaxID=3097547 RepID=UPI002A80DE68|nr:RagB/SusD family nutrient uptake outer membrane protein [Flavobacterium sp. NG2]WPR73146.1 RagB/SusD family nutrient uptake outer membrane protein [Flavobacterium sp. NG2]
MKNINNKFIKAIRYFSVVLVIGLASCSKDYLEIDAFGSPVVENFYKTPADMEQALTAAYNPMREQYTSFGQVWSSDLFMGDIGTDDIEKGGLSLADIPFLLQKQEYTLTTNNSYLNFRWDINFRGVLYANLVLDNIDKVTFTDANRKKEIAAEAYFLRAYYNFCLVTFFGGIPLYDKALPYEQANIPRASKADTYAFIEQDLLKAIQDLPSRFTKPSSFQGHADKGAALGYMMRVSLYQNKMDKVKQYGEELFKLPYELVALNTIFQPLGEWSKESIFEINYSSNTSALGTAVPKQMMPRTPDGQGFGFSQIKQNLVDEYESNDPRLSAFIFDDTRVYGTGHYNKKYAWKPFSGYSIPTVGGQLNSDQNVRLIRLADAYLMYAEAIYKDDPATAVQYVNKVRTRARGTALPTVVPDLLLTMNGQPLLNAIYHERRVELAGEGLRFQDLIRTGRAKTILAPLGFVENKNEVMPIPQTQIDLSNKILTQNNY